MSSANYQSPLRTQGTAEKSGAREHAEQAAGTAAEQGKHVAGVAKDEAQQVASEARQQARNLMSEARTQVENQSRMQRDRLVSNLRTFTGDLEEMAAGSSSGMANDLVRQVADSARNLTDRLDGREPSELLDEVRRFARRRPGAFLLGALAAGVVAGRIARGAKDASSDESTPAVRVTPDMRGTGGALSDTGQYPGDQAVGPAGAAARPTGISSAPGPYASQGSSWEDATTPGTAPLTDDQRRRDIA
ncbi:MAG TPA: hypothetical protein VFR23_15645 [Jiangellaceae bacterium]|nr:hypothetical protein [Jiangellaceae bacterium]